MKRKEIPFLQNIGQTRDGNTGVLLIALSQFGLSFSFNVVMSFMPFYIIKISPYNTYDTMIWIGMIMGLNSFVAAATAPVWGSLTSEFSPKGLFELAFLSNGIIFLPVSYTHL